MNAKRVLIVLSLLLVTLLLSGCGMLNGYVERAIAEQVQPGIPVTFANNQFLKCTYYHDAKRNSAVTSDMVSLSPGDSIYVDVDQITVTEPSPSILYFFSCFRIWSVGADGEYLSNPVIRTRDAIAAENGLLLKISDDSPTSGYAIEPLGAFSNRHITVEAYYMENGNKHLLGGTWSVNGESISGGTDISPVDSYTLEYDYHEYADSYYSCDSSPKYWYVNDSEHMVIFPEINADAETTAFSVEMHRYVSLSIQNTCIGWSAKLPLIGNHGVGIIQSIKINSELETPDYSEKTLSFPRLKVGDTLTIRVGSAYVLTGSFVEETRAVPLSNGYEYTITIPETDEEIQLTVSQRNSNADGTYPGFTLENADVRIIRANDRELEIGEALPGNGEKVSVEIIPNPDYYIEGFSDKTQFSFIKKVKFSEVLTVLSEHPAHRFVHLILTTSDEEGTYSYKLDGKSIAETELTARAGQKLTVEYTATPGYRISHSWFGADAVSSALTRFGRNDSISESIEISDDMDGFTIDREIFDIVVERGE